MAIPKGYTQVEYIESTGTQYIKTGFKPNNNTRLVMDEQLTADPALASQYLFGARTASNTVNFGLLLKTVFRSDYGESKVDSLYKTPLKRLTVDKNKNVCTLNDGSTTSTMNNASSTFQSAFELYLFASNDGGTAAYHAKMRLYSCQIYDNGTLIRDFVPCVNSAGTGGLYDLVNNKFYSNSGTGSFTAGAEVIIGEQVGSKFNIDGVSKAMKERYVNIGGVARKVLERYVNINGTVCLIYKAEGRLPSGYTEVEYIESSGSQYIDTGFTPNNNSRVDMEFTPYVAGGSPIFVGYGAAVNYNERAFECHASDGGEFEFNYGTSYEFVTDIVIGANTVISHDRNNVSVTCNGHEYSATLPQNTFTAPYTLTLFALHRASIYYGGKMRLYSCQIYDNGTLIRDFVPCTNPSGVAGLYDLVNKLFYGNSGTGSFTTGAAV